MEQWKPPTFGPKKEDEVVCYAFAIPNLPMFMNKEIKKFINYIEKLEGFQGLYPHYPHGTLLIFDTENNAKGGRNLIRAYPGVNFPVGDNIGEVFIKKKYLKGYENDN